MILSIFTSIDQPELAPISVNIWAFVNTSRVKNQNSLQRWYPVSVSMV